MKRIAKEMILMHKDDPVIVLGFDSENRAIKYSRQFNKELLPLPAKKDTAQIKNWISDRAIPASRHEINRILKENNQPNTAGLLLQNIGLSLTDCYWFKDPEHDAKWKDVNLFKNDFLGNYVSHKKDIKRLKYSPDSALQGELKKKWIIRENGTRTLVKGFFGSNAQQSLNEILGSRINSLQRFQEYVSYEAFEYQLDEQTSGICTFCDNFIKNDTEELISFWDIYSGSKIKGDTSAYWQTVSYCAMNGLDIDYIRDFLSYQILLDYLMTNTDRHFNNIGVIRDSQTLKFVRMAPIFDCGNSMFWEQKDYSFNVAKTESVKTHSFLEKEKHLLRYVTDYDALDLNKLPSDDEIRQIYANDINIPETRINALIQTLHYKAAQIEKLQKSQKREYKEFCPYKTTVKTKNSVYTLLSAQKPVYSDDSDTINGHCNMVKRNGTPFIFRNNPATFSVKDKKLQIKTDKAHLWITSEIVEPVHTEHRKQFTE